MLICCTELNVENSGPVASLHGKTLRVIFSDKKLSSIKANCFRRKGERGAGSFERWGNPNSLLTTSLISGRFRKSIIEALEAGDAQNYTTIRCDSAIGWDITAPADKFTPAELEEFEPSPESTGLRIRRTCSHLLAPQTNLVTIAFTVKMSRKTRIEVIITDLHPGDSVGRLEGNVTEREGRVFFHWGHPGE